MTHLDEHNVANHGSGMAPKKATEPEAAPGVVRIPAVLATRLVRMAELMSGRAGVTLPAAVVVRGVIERGLDALEAEFDRAKR
jgi:hypothetical protein